MKIIFESDRIRWQSETRNESEAVRALVELVFTGAPEEIGDDHGSVGELNYCCTPLPPTPFAS